jgi:hypothetical protein
MATASPWKVFVERFDRISVLVFVSSALLLAGMSLEIPAQPIDLGSICRARPGDASAKSGAAPTTSESARLNATGSTS